MNKVDKILAIMRCPKCMQGPLDLIAAEGVVCARCSSRYPLRDGIPDFLGDKAEVITPFQRVMQTPLVVSIYERMWRRLGYFIASSRSFDAEVQTILRLMRGAGGPILDLACGTGVFTRPIAVRSDGIVVGFDLSMPMLRQAARLAQRDGLSRVVLARGTAFRLPFANGSFRHVNCCGALHLFDQPDLALAEICRVLDPAGHLSVQTTIRPERSGGLAYVLERFIRFGFFNEEDLQRRVSEHGLKMLEIERHRISYTFLAGRSTIAACINGNVDVPHSEKPLGFAQK